MKCIAGHNSHKIAASGSVVGDAIQDRKIYIISGCLASHKDWEEFYRRLICLGCRMIIKATVYNRRLFVGQRISFPQLSSIHKKRFNFYRVIVNKQFSHSLKKNFS